MVVSNRGSFVGRTQGRVVVREAGRTVREIQFFKLKALTIASSGVSLSTDLIHECARQGIPIHFIDYTGRPYAELIAPRFPLFKLTRLQAETASDVRGLKLAGAFVEGKIRNQISLIKYYAKYRRVSEPDFSPAAGEAVIKMRALMLEIDNALTDEELSKGREKLMGIEGRSAAVYWGLIKALARL